MRINKTHSIIFHDKEKGTILAIGKDNSIVGFNKASDLKNHNNTPSRVGQSSKAILNEGRRDDAHNSSLSNQDISKVIPPFDFFNLIDRVRY